MQWKQPKNTDKYYWTEHVGFKMQFYGLSEQKIRSIIASPARKEEGIVGGTVAVMKPQGNLDENGKWKQEVWVMYKLRDSETNSKKQEKNSSQISKSKNLNIQKIRKLMQLKAKQLVIISAWRYPGVSPKRNPIPEEILREIEELI